MVVYPRFDPAEYISGVTKFRANILGGAPQLFIPIINLPNFEDIDFSSVKVAVSGAAPLPLTVLEKMVDAFDGPVCEAYGLTETTMLACCTPPFKEAVRQGSVGVPVFDTEVKLVDPSTGEDLPEGAEGEICIRGPQVMAGYWNRPEATAEVLTPDGWLLTGDIGRFDEDGYLYITDRKKDLILYKGYNVYPRELEEMVFTHPAVEQCAVVGRPDPETGEQPVAFVQLKAGREATAEEIADHVNAQVAPYKKLRDVLFVDAVPVSPAGKVLRRELRDSLNP
jgi:long-chain acyl-CoA synthetase